MYKLSLMRKLGEFYMHDNGRLKPGGMNNIINTNLRQIQNWLSNDKALTVLILWSVSMGMAILCYLKRNRDRHLKLNINIKS